MIHLACWAVPVRGGYVLRADRAARSAVWAADGRSPHLVDWAITIVHPESAPFSAERAQREAVLAIETSMRHRPAPVPSPKPRFACVRRSWKSLALGTALVVVSGAHWVPALAGAWLLAGRGWISALLGVGAPHTPDIAWTAAEVGVAAAPHAGLSQIASLLASDFDGEAGYGPALALARTLGLGDAAAVYEALAAHQQPATLLAEMGVWMPETRAHDPTLAATVTRPDLALEPPVEDANDQSSDDPMDELP